LHAETSGLSSGLDLGTENGREWGGARFLTQVTEHMEMLLRCKAEKVVVSQVDLGLPSGLLSFAGP
jgi:hypothetical protein